MLINTYFDWEMCMCTPNVLVFATAHAYAHMQHKAILGRQLPEKYKLNVAKRIENKLFSKVGAAGGYFGFALSWSSHDG